MGRSVQRGTPQEVQIQEQSPLSISMQMVTLTLVVVSGMEGMEVAPPAEVAQA
jgi:hypothetical protein